MAKNSIHHTLASLDAERWMFIRDSTCHMIDCADGQFESNELLNHVGASRDPVVIAVPSAWCYACSVTTPSVRGRQLRQAVLFEAEHLLPLSIEDLIFWTRELDETTFVVGVHRDKLKTLVDQIESTGTQVLGALPAAFYIAICANHPETESDQVIIQDNAAFDCVTLESGIPTSWIHRKEIIDDVLLGTDPIEKSATAVVSWKPPLQHESGDIPPDQGVSIKECLEKQIDVANNLYWDIQMIHGAEVQSKFLDRVARCAFPLILILLLLMVGIYRRSQQLNESIELQLSTQQQLYRTVDANGSIPVSISDRLQSLLRSTQGQSSGDKVLSISILLDFRNLVESFPEPLNHEINYLHMDSQQAQISGTASRHEDSLLLASKIRTGQSGRFQTTGTPRIDLLQDNRVQFWIDIPFSAQRNTVIDP